MSNRTEQTFQQKLFGFRSPNLNSTLNKRGGHNCYLCNWKKGQSNKNETVASYNLLTEGKSCIYDRSIKLFDGLFFCTSKVGEGVEFVKNDVFGEYGMYMLKVYLSYAALSYVGVEDLFLAYYVGSNEYALMASKFALSYALIKIVNVVGKSLAEARGKGKDFVDYISGPVNGGPANVWRSLFESYIVFSFLSFVGFDKKFFEIFDANFLYLIATKLFLATPVIEFFNFLVSSTVDSKTYSNRMTTVKDSLSYLFSLDCVTKMVKSFGWSARITVFGPLFKLLIGYLIKPQIKEISGVLAMHHPLIKFITEVVIMCAVLEGSKAIPSKTLDLVLLYLRSIDPTAKKEEMQSVDNRAFLTVLFDELRHHWKEWLVNGIILGSLAGVVKPPIKHLPNAGYYYPKAFKEVCKVKVKPYVKQVVGLMNKANDAFWLAGYKVTNFFKKYQAAYVAYLSLLVMVAAIYLNTYPGALKNILGGATIV